jgi:hypothetical protein
MHCCHEDMWKLNDSAGGSRLRPLQQAGHSPGDPSERKRDPAAFLLTLLSGTCGFGAMRVPHSCGQVGPMVEARD